MLIFALMIQEQWQVKMLVPKPRQEHPTALIFTVFLIAMH
jgi:hypothetical protein